MSHIRKLALALAATAALATAPVATAPAFAAAHVSQVGGADMFADKNIIENAVNSPIHKTLVAAVQAAGLVETLSGEGPFTVFAPTDEAFAALPEGTVETLLKPENKDQLTKILTCHVVAANAMSDAIAGMIADDNGAHPVQTVGGCTLTAKMDGDNIIIEDEQGNAATVTTADVKQSNGVIHVIDAVLLPAQKDAMKKSDDSMASGSMSSDSMAKNVSMVGGAEMFAEKNIIENAVNSPIHTTLVAAVKAGDLVETLSGPGPFTVFAPVNDAFAALPDGTVDTLLKPENKGTLQKVLTAHVVAGDVKAEQLAQMIKDHGGYVNLSTVSGDVITARMDDNGVYLFDESGNVGRVTQTDVNQSNGVIHVVDTVLVPK